jgi:hypothetical protein
MTVREAILEQFQTYKMLTPAYASHLTGYSQRTCNTELFKMHSECLFDREIYEHYTLSKNGRTLLESKGCGIIET